VWQLQLLGLSKVAPHLVQTKSFGRCRRCNFLVFLITGRILGSILGFLMDFLLMEGSSSSSERFRFIPVDKSGIEKARQFTELRYYKQKLVQVLFD
jgi:hypothetical protein